MQTMEDVVKMLFKEHVIIFFCLFISVFLSANEKMVVRFENPDEHLVTQFIQSGYEIAAYRPGDFLDLVVNHEELTALQEIGYDPFITQTEEGLKTNLQPQTRSIPGYRNYGQILEYLEDINEEYPEITRLYNIGNSWGKIYTDEGNDYYEDYNFDIWALKLTTFPDSLKNKPAVFYMGAHHAREPLSAEVPLVVLDYLLSEYDDENDLVMELIDETEIWFAPLVNPDGHKVVLDSLDVWWRKNIRDNNNNGEFDSNKEYGSGVDGVDLNRNYAFEWQFDPRIERATYTGPNPGSEPEVQAMKELMANVHFVAGITYHTYGEMVLFPYGYAHGCRAPDHLALEDLAKEMAYSTPRYGRPGYYLPQQSIHLYPARGVTDDYAYGEYGIFCFTVELATEFIPSIKEIRQVSQDNIEAAMILLERIHKSSLTGIITDGVTGEPLEAEIFVIGIDDTGSFRHPYKSRKQFGRYYRILLPGEYKVVFSSSGYADSDTFMVKITEDKQTELDVSLYPQKADLVSGKVTDFFSNEPIEKAVIELTNHETDYVLTDKEGVFTLENIYYGNYELRVSASDYGTLYYSLEVQEQNVYLLFELYPSFFVDSFDNLDSWETTGEWGLSSMYSYMGDYSLADSPKGKYVAPLISSAKLLYKIDLSTAYNASLTFMAKNDLEENHDFCYVQILSQSQDKSEWINLVTITGEADWSMYDISLAEYTGQKVYVRFLFKSAKTDNEKNGIYIDDFRIYVSSPELSGDQSTKELIPLSLQQNYPNPFNVETTISFSLDKQLQVNLYVYNIIGQKIRTLINSDLPAGNHSVIWDGLDDNKNTVGSGIYFYRLNNSEYAIIKKMLLLK